MNNIHDLVLIRFADVLLMQSELKKDVAGINEVRKRAGLNPIAAYSEEALRNERRWELACEGIRWNDLRRWHIAAAALEKQNGVAVYYCGQLIRILHTMGVILLVIMLLPASRKCLRLRYLWVP